MQDTETGGPWTDLPALADPRVKFGDLPNQDLPLEQASDVLRTWRAKNPAQFGRVLSEVIIKWALRGTEGTDG